MRNMIKASMVVWWGGWCGSGPGLESWVIWVRLESVAIAPQRAQKSKLIALLAALETSLPCRAMEQAAARSPA